MKETFFFYSSVQDLIGPVEVKINDGRNLNEQVNLLLFPVHNYKCRLIKNLSY